MPFIKGHTINNGRKRRKKTIDKMRKAHLGKQLTKETKQKIKQTLSGRKLSKKHKRRIGNAGLGRKLSDTTKKKMSNSKKGEKNYRWKGGITPLRHQIRNCFEYRQWRSDIFTRDDFTCQECNKRGVYLEAHHFPKSFKDILNEYKIKTLEQALVCAEFWNINNGITLCKECHKKA